MFRPQTSKSGFLFQGVKVNSFGALDISMRTYNDIQLLSFFSIKNLPCQMKQIFVKCIKRPEGRKILSELIPRTDILTDGQNNLFSSYQQDYIRWLDIAYRFFSKIRHKLDRLRPHGRGQQRGGEQRGVALLLDHRHHRLSRLPPHHARRRIRVCNMYILICVLLYIDNDVSHL